MDVCTCPPDVTIGSYRNSVVLGDPPASFGFTRNVFVDGCLAHEIRALWGARIMTVASCCGHHQRIPIITVAPEYVGAMRTLGYLWVPECDHTTFLAMGFDEARARVESEVLRSMADAVMPRRDTPPPPLVQRRFTGIHRFVRDVREALGGVPCTICGAWGATKWLDEHTMCDGCAAIERVRRMGAGYYVKRLGGSDAR